MSHWQQTFNSQFVDSFDRPCYDLEILNSTSFKFARPETPINSHTSAKISAREKLRNLLPLINTDTSRSSTRDRQLPKDHLTHSQNYQNYLLDTTRPTERSIKFIADSDHDLSNKNDKSDQRKSISKGLKSRRRATIPSRGMSFPVTSSTSFNYDQIYNNQNISVLSNDPIAGNSSDMTSFTSPCDPPPLSPCSSTSSISSSIGTPTPAQSIQSHRYSTGKQIPSSSQHYNLQFPSFGSSVSQLESSPLAIRPKLNVITENPYQNETRFLSLPDMVNASSYENLPWSPAVNFLANLAQATISKPNPDDEGQQIGDYIIGKVIGRGGFSTVKEAIRMGMNDYSGMEKVAVKIIQKNQDSDYNDRIQALLEREICIWKALDHPNIVQMVSSQEDDYATYVFSEYCPGGTLLDYVKKNSKGEGKGLDEDEARNIFLEIAEAVRYLHDDMRLVHKDIKLDNILLDKDDTWKLCDFGLTEFQNDANGFANLPSCDEEAGGSLAYCAPEQARSKIPLKDPAADIWSLGVVLYALVVNHLPFMDDFAPRLQLKILNGRYDESALITAGISDDLRDLLKLIFKTNPAQRLTISQVLEHRWCVQ
ncbi:22743_t:CDS:2 [Dentiscutata erythropus]|uniref:22743_t:CDS:1 n=1 Tax=Dentiscutata erythropus TaxID=1348616 RepID=A0A9N9AHX8_9GLOM|nr:22743_t:CDS:2 [Dentiscutata erythropus]